MGRFAPHPRLRVEDARSTGGEFGEVGLCNVRDCSQAKKIGLLHKFKRRRRGEAHEFGQERPGCCRAIEIGVHRNYRHTEVSGFVNNGGGAGGKAFGRLKCIRSFDIDRMMRKQDIRARFVSGANIVESGIEGTRHARD